MNKLTPILTSTALLFSVNAIAQNKAPEKKAPAQPEIFVSVFDASQNPFTDTNTTTLSRSAENRRLCWVANGKFNKSVNLVETFNAPAAQTMMVGEHSRVSTSNDGKTNTIRGTEESYNNGKYLFKCWRFDKNDPVGKYTLQIKADKQTFPALSFSVTE